MKRKNTIGPLVPVVLAISLIALSSFEMCAKTVALSSKPPKGAVILFNGNDASQWEQLRNRHDCEWRVKDGYLEVVPGKGDLRTRANFKDFRLHVEFNIPYMPNKRGQARGNSGVILQNRYEVQVLDSYGVEKPRKNDCGAIYGQRAPNQNACKPPNTWQSYDILFKAARMNKDGSVMKLPVVTIFQNGIEIQHNVTIKGPTGARSHMKVASKGPIVLQDHGCKVKYRNIWIEAL